MEKIEKKIASFFIRTGRFFAKNWITGIIALFCAMILWGFVLTDQNPERVKTLTNIPVSFEGESDLIARKLVVNGDYAEILPKVTVRVHTELLSYTDLSASNITATVSLRNVNSMGEYVLEVRAVSSVGTVVSVSPSTVTVPIDRLSSKNIPVEISTAGNQEADYWYSDPTIANDTIEIEGALSFLSTINRAVGIVDITGRNESFSDAVTLSLLDANGTPVDTARLYSDVPAAKIQMEILPKKQVPFDLAGALENVDQLPSTYEISSQLTIPAHAVIVGEQSILDTIDSLKLSSLDVWALLDKIKDDPEAADDPVSLNIIVPDDVRIIGDLETVDAYITVREKIISKNFVDIPIRLLNRNSKYNYTLTSDTMNITLTGKITLLNQIEDSDIRLYLDMANLTPGVHSVPITVGLSNNEMLMETAYELGSNEITVTVTEKR